MPSKIDCHIKVNVSLIMDSFYYLVLSVCLVATVRYDYVLDLISEMEVPPGFPVCRSHFLVSSDRSREPHMLQRNQYSDT